MGSTAVDIQDVSKRFRLYHEKYTSLKEKMIHFGRVPHDDLWALRDVSFDVQEGETVGILGRNGSGKSTLLKCICGVLQPTSGQVVVRGKLAGLLELGAGFQQDLSGRDNIYLNGAMLGLSKRDVDRVFDDIVEFAELSQFIDNQVKFYSSGMYVRLGFAVAVNVNPDVLVIDEVLAVGDERFQRKCIERVKQFQKEGRTILFVTHSPDQVRAICDRAIVLADGLMVSVGTPGEAVRTFREKLLEAGAVLALDTKQTAAAQNAPNAPDVPNGLGGPSGTQAATSSEVARKLAASMAVSVAHDPGAHDPGAHDPGGHGAGATASSVRAPGTRTAVSPRDLLGVDRPVRVTGAAARFPGEAERRYLLTGESMTLRAAYAVSGSAHEVVFQIEIRSDDGTILYKSDSDILGMRLATLDGSGAVDFYFGSLALFDGIYDVNIGVEVNGSLSDWREPACQFEVMNPGRSTGLVHMPAQVNLVPPELLDGYP